MCICLLQRRCVILKLSVLRLCKSVRGGVLAHSIKVYLGGPKPHQALLQLPALDGRYWTSELLQGKDLLVPFECYLGWAPQPVSTPRKREKVCAPVGSRQNIPL
jgi:hypothetical protein